MRSHFCDRIRSPCVIWCVVIRFIRYARRKQVRNCRCRRYAPARSRAGTSAPQGLRRQFFSDLLSLRRRFLANKAILTLAHAYALSAGSAAASVFLRTRLSCPCKSNSSISSSVQVSRSIGKSFALYAFLNALSLY